MRHGFLGFHVSLYPTILDDNAAGDPRTTWFVKLGLTGYFLGLDTGSGRMSSLYVGAAPLQGLNNDWNVSAPVSDGTAGFFDAGARWAAFHGLDVRLGVGVLVGQGKVLIRPTPGLSYSIPF